MTEISLEAARKQKINNLQLKTACLEMEQFITELHIHDWSESRKKELLEAHQRARDLLGAVETKTKWNLTQSYDIQKLMRVCGLEMSVRELHKPEDKPHIMDIIALKKTLQELKQHRNKTRVVSFSGVIDNSLTKLEDLENELRTSQLDVTDLAHTPRDVVKYLEDCMNVQNVQAALVGNEEQITQQLLSIEKCKEIRNIALSDGEMSIAEEQFYIKAQLLERLVELVRDKFRIINITDEETKKFNVIHDVQKKAQQEANALRETKRQLKDRCNADLTQIHAALKTADEEDAEAIRTYQQHRDKSATSIKENEETQDECWRKIQELERQLQKLGNERFEAVKRRIDANDAEEKRKIEYQQFLDVVSQHKKLLELTAHNCDLALHAIDTVETVVSEGCNAIKSRRDRTMQESKELQLHVHQEYLGVFRRLYKTLGQLVYKKEKKLEEVDRNIRTTHIQLEFCIETFDPNAKKHSDSKKELYRMRANVEEELQMLKDKMATALEMFRPTEEVLVEAGVEFVHPIEEVEEGNIQRRSKILEYRAHLSKQEDVKIAAEREEIKRAKQLLIQAGPRTPGNGGPRQIEFDQSVA